MQGFLFRKKDRWTLRHAKMKLLNDETRHMITATDRMRPFHTYNPLPPSPPPSYLTFNSSPKAGLRPSWLLIMEETGAVWLPTEAKRGVKLIQQSTNLDFTVRLITFMSFISPISVLLPPIFPPGISFSLCPLRPGLDQTGSKGCSQAAPPPHTHTGGRGGRRQGTQGDPYSEESEVGADLYEDTGVLGFCPPS